MPMYRRGWGVPVSDPFYGRPVSKAAQFDEANMVVLCQSTTRQVARPA
jgi:hypothetical protein